MIGERIELLALAIRNQEGWHLPLSGANVPEGGSHSYRTHNPGNLRSSVFQSGTLDGFAVFHSDFVGMFALQYDIWCKANGKTVTGLTGESTLSDLFYKYAPPTENDTEKYIARILMLTGFDREMKLSELLAK